MNIKTEEHGWSVYDGFVWTAYDSDTYDGAEDSHCPVGWGNTEKDAINDLVEQFIEKLESRVDDLKAANQLLLSRSGQIAPETCAPQPHGDLQILEEGQDSGPLPYGHGEAASEVITPDAEDLQCRCLGRMDDDFHPSDYNGPRPNWEERQGQE